MGRVLGQRYAQHVGVLRFGDPVVYTQRLELLGVEIETIGGEPWTRLDGARAQPAFA